MKKFDYQAAIKGADVCLADGTKAEITSIYEKEIVVVVGARRLLFRYDLDGVNTISRTPDLCMKDDDYLAKLERGEYDDIDKFSIEKDRDLWRATFAEYAMQGLCASHGTTKSAEHIARGAVECADALIEELKKDPYQ